MSFDLASIEKAVLNSETHYHALPGYLAVTYYGKNHLPLLNVRDLAKRILKGDAPHRIYLGKCTAKGCRYAERITVDRTIEGFKETTKELVEQKTYGKTCPNHGKWLAWHSIEGHVNNLIPCDSRCTNARGHVCECSCGGENHGIGHQHG